jgi:hypothetical protein
MRLEARIKSGFYPLLPKYIPLIAKHLQADSQATIFDPCCGKGVAVAELAKAIGIEPHNVYGSELDAGRAAEAKTVVKNCFGPIDFLTSFGGGQASVIYCNPPFDDELGGGGRVELRFVSKCLEFAKQNTVFVIVVPRRTLVAGETFQVFNRFLYGVRCYSLPDAPFSECVLFGYRRKVDIQPEWNRWNDYRYPRENIEKVDTPFVCRPGSSVTMHKRFYTEPECRQIASGSAANRILRPLTRNRTTDITPPMSLTRGHIALLLASGLFDGVVEPEGERPHVVRGSVSKIKKTDVSRAEGKVIERIAEQILLTIRIADTTGVHTLSSEVATEEGTEESCKS